MSNNPEVHEESYWEARARAAEEGLFRVVQALGFDTDGATSADSFFGPLTYMKPNNVHLTTPWDITVAYAEEYRKEMEDEADKADLAINRLADVVKRVHAYADDRAFHSRRHNSTVNSGRISSDLYHILDPLNIEPLKWQYSYAEKWVDDSGVYERVTFDTEAKARQYYVDNAPRLVGYNMEQESVGDPDRLVPVLEKRRVVEPGDWLPLEAMTVDPVTGV